MPASILIDPFVDILIDKVQKNPKINGYISTVEFSFLQHIITHEKISTDLSLKLLRLFYFVIVTKPFLAHYTFDLLFELISKNIH